MHPALPKTEIIFYHLLWIFALSYSAYNVYLSGSYFNKRRLDLFGNGWKILSRMKDTSDIFWAYSVAYVEDIWYWLVLHLMSAEVISYVKAQFLPLWYVLFTCSFIIYRIGIIPLLFILIHPLLMYLICIPRSYTLLWIATFCALIFSCTHTLLDHFHLPGADQYLFFTCISWGHLRALSFGFNQISQCTGASYVGLFTFLSYYLYYPIFFNGPFITYEQFLAGITSPLLPWGKKRVAYCIANIMRFVFWLLFVEFTIHFIYASAFISHAPSLKKLNAWSLYGVGFCIGQLFMLKYVVIYGLPGVFAREEQYDVPEHPKCIACIHLYSDMWRYFDRGLYNFILKYIYIPCCGKSPNLHSKFFASFACFFFVYIWHGLSTNILIWSVLNYAGVSLELFCKKLSVNRHYRHWEKRILSTPQNVRRFHALIATPLFIISAISNFYFLGSVDVGSIYMRRILEASVIEKFSLFFFCYCCCQVSMETKNREEWRCQQKK